MPINPYNKIGCFLRNYIVNIDVIESGCNI